MKLIIYALLLFGITTTGFTQQLSNDIFPSEDELLEALNQGEIDSEQYQILQEIFIEGISEKNIYLLEEIPYLNKFSVKNLKDYSIYQKEQLDYISSFPKRKIKNGDFIYKYYQKFNENEDARYRLKARYKFNSSWQFDLRLQKEYSSNERIVHRSLYYQSTNGIMNYLYFGNYSKKIGLGAVFGYRGKLLDFSGNIDDESFLFPDYGGKNGFLLNLGNKKYNTIIFTNVIRDYEHLFRTIGGSIKQESESYTLQPILSVTRLSNRESSVYVDDYKTGINLSKKYKEISNEIEFIYQYGIKQSFAVVAEGEINFEKSFDATYSFWNYANDYIDLESGSKSGLLRRSIELNEIDYSFSSRRTGQRGGLLNLSFHPKENLQFYNSILYSKINNDSLLFEYSPAIIKQQSSSVLLKFDYIYKYKKNSLSVTNDSRVCGEIYFKNNILKVRNNISFKYKTGSPNYIGWFCQIRLKSNSSEYEIWSNFNKIDIRKLRNDYWYLYAKHKFKIAKTIFGVTKLSHSYSRNSLLKHSTTISSELQIAL